MIMPQHYCCTYIARKKGNVLLCTSGRCSGRLDRDDRTNACHGTAVVQSRSHSIPPSPSQHYCEGSRGRCAEDPAPFLGAESLLCARRCDRTGPSLDLPPASTYILLAQLSKVGAGSQGLS